MKAQKTQIEIKKFGKILIFIILEFHRVAIVKQWQISLIANQFRCLNTDQIIINAYNKLLLDTMLYNISTYKLIAT